MMTLKVGELLMKKLPSFQGKSQYDEDIRPHYRNSACGPVTAFVILRYLEKNDHVDINMLYKQLRSTKIGLFTWRFVRHLRIILGPQWIVEKCTIEDTLQEIDAGRPVAAKFDKWFRLQWTKQFSFTYHWVPIIGYEYQNGHLYLLIHDNGSKYKKSRVHAIPYKRNAPILTFIKIQPQMTHS